MGCPFDGMSDALFSPVVLDPDDLLPLCAWAFLYSEIVGSSVL